MRKIIIYVAMVTDVHVELLTDTTVRVSWRRFIADEITNYTVYYKPSDNMESEQSVTVPSSESSVVIENLMTNVKYQFQVAATAELEEVVFPGDRSSSFQILVGALSTTPSHTCKIDLICQIELILVFIQLW